MQTNKDIIAKGDKIYIRKGNEPHLFFQISLWEYLELPFYTHRGDV